MADPKVPARPDSALPALLSEAMRSEHLPTGNHAFGFQHNVIARNQRVVDASTSYNLARARQSDSLISVIDSRMRLARKYAEVIDLPNLIADDQRQREHSRAISEHRRVLENVNAVHELHLAIAQHDLEIAQIRERGVRAHRNLEAAQRVKDAEIDSWYAQAAARRNESEATRQDTDADLHRSQSATTSDALKAVATEQVAQALAAVEHQIELERDRGNAAGVLALSNLRARLRAA